MPVHGSLAEDKAFGDRSVSQSGREQPQHLRLSCRQTDLGGARRQCGRLGWFVVLGVQRGQNRQRAPGSESSRALAREQQAHEGGPVSETDGRV